MDISELTLKLIILLTPGALAVTIYRLLTVSHKPQSDFMFVITSIMFGMFAYLILQITYSFPIFIHNIFTDGCNSKYNLIKAFSKITDSAVIPYSEVLYACLISVLIGFILTRIDSKKTLYKFAQRLNISNKYGDENLFSYFLNSTNLEWVYVRDVTNALTYLGVIKIFSETEEFKELVLEQVTVYNYPDSEELYTLDRIYLCLQKDNIIIEQAKTIDYGEEE